MKNKYLLILTCAALVFACKNSSHYSIEIIYKTTRANGDSSSTSKKESISASSDSTAYLKAQKEFSNTVSERSDNEKGVPVKFVVRNDKGNVVLQPGAFKAQELEENLYPNQKPKAP